MTQSTLDVSPRGQSSVLAVVLLVGIVAVGTAGVFLYGVQTASDTHSHAESAQVRQSLLQLDRELDTVARTRDNRRSVSLDLYAVDGAVRKEDTGRIVLANATGYELVNRSIGSIVYDHDGTTYAIQAGGVWERQGNGSTMLSPPPLQYNEGTLTLPITVVTGDEELGSGGVRLTKERTVAPLSDPRIVSGDLVTLRVTSDYYRAWARYFRQDTNDVAVSVDAPNRTVIVHLGRPGISGRFDQGVLATGGARADVVVGTNGSATLDGPARAEGQVRIGGNPNSWVSGETDEGVDADLVPLDSAIRMKVNDARSDPSVVSGDLDGAHRVTAGTYYDDDGVNLTANTTVDLANGNVTYVLDGNLTILDHNLTVVNATGNRALRVYLTGDFSLKNGRVSSNASGTNAGDVQIYGTSTMQVGIGGGGTTYFEGTIYAPRYEPAVGPGENNAAYPNYGAANCVGVDVCIATGNPTVVGSITAGPTAIQQSAQVVYDPGLAGVRPTLELPADAALPPPITYLNVAIHEVRVDRLKNT